MTTPTSVGPEVEGPITAGNGRVVLVSTSLDLAAVGYVQEEYFLSGTGRAFTAADPLEPDGRWTVAPSEGLGPADYATRLVVHRPVDGEEFSGTVVVEWLNVSAGFDSAPDWLAAHNTLIRDRVAWIGVSAQAVGVQGGGPAVGGLAAGGVRAADPQRYGSLHHPGDSYSYDIFTQVGRVARSGLLPYPTHPGSASAVEQVIAIGESQSAFRMVTYVNAIQPIEHAFDGFLVHSRGGSAAPLAQDPQPEITAPEGTIIRTDLDVPVLVLQTETDLTLLESVPARQPDTERVRFWEVAGTAHADAYTAWIGFNDAGDGAAEAHLLDMSKLDGGPLGCANPINAGPGYAVLQAGLHGLIDWCAGGDPPPRAPLLELEPADPANNGVVIARDEHGNARGGIRTPLVDVPIAALRGDGNGEADAERFCRLFGSTVPFDEAKLTALYPDPDDYIAAFERSANDAVKAGFLLPQDAENLRQGAIKVAAHRADLR